MKIIVVGSSSGIGHYLAKNLTERGHEVWGLARRPQLPMPETVLEGSAGVLVAKYRFSQCDVTDWDAVEAVAQQVASEWTTVDGLICCTGVQGAVGPTMSLNPKDWSQTVHQNIDGVFFSLRAFFPLLINRVEGPGIESQYAKVICFSGGGASAPRANFSGYGIAKAALVRLVETLAEEWKGEKIDINAVAPGAIRTRSTEEVVRLGADVVGQKEFDHALKVMETGGGSLEKVFELVQFLLSKKSDGVSGKLISAQWDPWKKIQELAELPELKDEFIRSDAYTLRRVVPQEWS